jgi:hypothetical protein
MVVNAGPGAGAPAGGGGPGVFGAAAMAKIKMPKGMDDFDYEPAPSLRQKSPRGPTAPASSIFGR